MEFVVRDVRDGRVVQGAKGELTTFTDAYHAWQYHTKMHVEGINEPEQVYEIEIREPGNVVSM